MPVTVVALLSINESDPMALGKYFEVTGPLLERAGAKIVKRFDINEVVVGKRKAQTVVIVEYPDKAAVDSVFGSPEYASITEVRDRAFNEYHINVVSDPDEGREGAAAATE
jgi:uncharacterized protein (DUF1330 family)